MRRSALAALGIAAYAAFLLATMPARFAARQVEAAAPGRLEFREARGTVWHGHAQAVVALPGGRLPLERVEWRFKPARLAAGKLAFDVALGAAGLEARFEGARSFSQWELRDLEARGEAALVASALPWIAPWRPEGAVTVRASQLAFDGAGLRGEALAEWRGAALGLSEVKPLGTYRAQLRAEGEQGRLDVTTLDGALRIAGRGDLALPGRFAFSGEARAEPAQARALAPLLDLLGPPRADGARAIEWRSP